MMRAGCILLPFSDNDSISTCVHQDAETSPLTAAEGEEFQRCFGSEEEACQESLSKGFSATGCREACREGIIGLNRRESFCKAVDLASCEASAAPCADENGTAAAPQAASGPSLQLPTLPGTDSAAPGPVSVTTPGPRNHVVELAASRALRASSPHDGRSSA